MPCRQSLTQAYYESQIFPRPQKQAWQGQALGQGCLTPQRHPKKETGSGFPEPQGLFCDEVLNLETPTRGQTHGSIQAAQQGKLAVQICVGV